MQQRLVGTCYRKQSQADRIEQQHRQRRYDSSQQINPVAQAGRRNGANAQVAYDAAAASGRSLTFRLSPADRMVPLR